MPRRIYPYEPGRGWEVWNLIATIGTFIQAIPMLLFVTNLIFSYWKGPDAGDDPLDAWHLQRAARLLPPPHHLASLPPVARRPPPRGLQHPQEPARDHHLP